MVAVLVTVKLPIVTVVSGGPVTDPVTKALPVDGSRIGTLYVPVPLDISV